MKKLLLLAIIFVLATRNLQAQLPTLSATVLKEIPNYRNSLIGIRQDNNGNTYRCYDLVGASGATVIVQLEKLNPAGQNIWTKYFTIPPNVWWMSTSEIQLDRLGNILVMIRLGYAENTKFHVIKYSPSGNRTWEVDIPIEPDTYMNLTEIATDHNGNIFLAGSFSVFPQGSVSASYPYCLIKLSANGNRMWTEAYLHPYAQSQSYDRVKIALDQSGYPYVLAAVYEPNASGSGGLRKMTIVKHSPQGYFQWARRYSYLPEKGSTPGELLISSDGSILASGISQNHAETEIVTTVKYSPNGTLQWANNYSPSGNNRPMNSRLATDMSGNVYRSFYLKGSALVGTVAETIKYSAAGVQLWRSFYDYSDSTFEIPQDIKVDPQGNVYVLENTYVHVAAAADGNYPPYDKDHRSVLVKFNSGGIKQWDLKIPGSKTSNKTVATDLFFATGGAAIPDFTIAAEVVTQGSLPYPYNPKEAALFFYRQATAPVIGLRSIIDSSSQNSVVAKRVTAFPNPFSSSITINFEIQQAGEITLTIVDAAGRELATLINQRRTAGVQQTVFNAGNLSSQTLYYRLSVKTGNKVVITTKPIVLQR